MTDRILVLGSGGQVGTDLVSKLRSQYGDSQVIASDIKEVSQDYLEQGPYEILDVLDKDRIKEVFTKYKPTQVYHLAALLSATAEKHPKFGWDLNMNGLFNVFDASLEHKVGRVFWPSSIAVFGPNTPRTATPQHTIMDPNTIYGISKLAGERYCEYYHNRWGLDVRSIRYPGLIGWKALPGGGTTDYAVDIFHKALSDHHYSCFLESTTALPMMYMDDAIKATIGITEADSEKVKIRSAYNIAGMTFTPEEIAAEISKHIQDFKISYDIDHRQAIAASWPQSINDIEARTDWGWFPEYDLQALVKEMLDRLGSKES